MEQQKNSPRIDVGQAEKQADASREGPPPAGRPRNEDVGGGGFPASCLGNVRISSRRQGVEAPPSGNTGASAAWVGIDYLSMTLPSALVTGLECEALLELLGLDSLGLVIEWRSGGFRGWQASAEIAPGGVLAWGGQGGTAHLDLTGGALGHLRALGLDVFGWLRYVLEQGVRVGRVDIAADDEAGLVTRERVIDAVSAGDYVTHSRSVSEHRALVGDRGWTVYFGRRTSPTFVRIYDKAAEQGLDGVSWTRVEAEFKRERAHAVIVEWCLSGWSVASALGLLRGALDFRRDDGTVTKSRWDLLDWWGAFLGAVDLLRVRVGSITRSLDDVARWLFHSVSSALAACEAAFGDVFMRHLMSRGRARMSVQHERMVSLYAVGA